RRRPPRFPYATVCRSEQNGLLVFEPVVARFPRPVVVQLVTQGGLDVTLRFEMKASPDTQVHIVRPDQEKRDRLCDERVNAVTARSEEHTSELQSRENL